MQLGLREEDCEEPVVFFVSGVCRVSFAALLACAERGGCAVVTIGDIGDRDGSEGLDPFGGVAFDAPYSVADIIDGYKIIQRIVLLRLQRRGRSRFVSRGYVRKTGPEFAFSSRQ